MFPEPILTSRLPSLVHEDSVLYVIHVLIRLASILLLSLPLPKFLADLQELDLLPERIAVKNVFVFGKIVHLLHVRVAGLASARCNCVLRCFLPQY